MTIQTFTRTNKKVFGFWILMALVIGNMIGAGIFSLPASLASLGTISIFAWIFTTIGALLLALLFIHLSELFPKTGGPYIYARAGFGDFVGFAAAYSYWLAWAGGNAGMAVAFTGYLSAFWPAINEHSSSGSFLTFLISASAVWITTFINILGLRSTGVMQLLTTIIKITPLVALSIIGLLYMHPSYLTEFNISGKSNFLALSSATTLVLYSFVGLESAIVPSDDATNSRAMNRATIWGTLFTALLYIFSTIALMGLIPAVELKNSPSPFADAGKLFLGNEAGLIFAITAMVACFGALIGSIFIQVQVTKAAALDNLFPALFAKKGRFNTPTMGYVISAAMMTLLLGLTLNQHLVKQFTWIVLFSTFGFVIPYFISSMTGLMASIKNPQQLPRKKRISTMLIAIGAGLYSFWIMIGAGAEIGFYGSLLFFTAFPIYILLRWRRDTFTYDDRPEFEI